MNDGCQETTNTMTAGAIFGASERSSSSGSMRSIRPILSMDLRLEDVMLDGGGFLSALSSDDIMDRLQSAELVEDILLPDSAAAASVALKAERTSATNTSNEAPPSKQQGGKIEKLTSKIEKMSTSDEIALLDEKFWISSSEWLPNNDVKQANSVDMNPSMLLGVVSHLSTVGSGNVAVSQYSKSPTRNPRGSFSGPQQNPPLALASLKSPPESQAATMAWSQNPATCLGLMHLSSPTNISMRNSLATYPPPNSNPEGKGCGDSISTNSSSSKPPTKNLKPEKRNAASMMGKKRASTGKKKKKKRRPRQLDMTRAVEATDHDILFGRGGKINNHPGNLYFRDKALQFLPWYMQSSKEEKEKIADVLIESVENEGRRFLEQNKEDKLWYKVVRGQHIKACATLRDLKDGMKKRS